MKRKALGAILLSSSLALSSLAVAEDAAIQPMQLGDAGLSCSQLISEASAMEEIIGGAPEGGLFSSDQAIGATTGLAQSAALHAGAGQLAGGLGAVGGAFQGLAKRKQKQKELERAQAEKRWFYVVGLYSGAKCDQKPATVE